MPQDDEGETFKYDLEQRDLLPTGAMTASGDYPYRGGSAPDHAPGTIRVPLTFLFRVRDTR